jgi:hypothetical protein
MVFYSFLCIFSKLSTACKRKISVNPVYGLFIGHPVAVVDWLIVKRGTRTGKARRCFLLPGKKQKIGVAPATATGPQLAMGEAKLVMRSNWQCHLHLRGPEVSSSTTTPCSSKLPPLGLPPSPPPPPSEAACLSSQTTVLHVRYHFASSSLKLR